MLRPTSRQAHIWLRPFYSVVLVTSLLAATSYIFGLLSPSQNHHGSLLEARASTQECRDVHHKDDRCAYVKANCGDEQAGIIPYLTLYYCEFNYNRFSGLALLVLWLGLLFSTIGIAASDFFSPNLQTIANVLSMPENLAGVTFLAIGNGSPDVFSTVMAMRSNSAAMAVGELIGAAGFITAIVAGTVSLVGEFKVGRDSFVRDSCFFIIAIGFTMGFLIDGHLYPLECVFMIGYYVFYVCVVSGSHWYSARKGRRRAHAAEEGTDLLASGSTRQEPYRDNPSEPAGQEPSARSSFSFLTAVDQTPRIDLEGGSPDYAEEEEEEEEEEDMERRRQVAAEIASNMRVRRPTNTRRNTATFVRPSLVGALEFKSALNHFKKEEAQALSTGDLTREYGHRRRHSALQVPRAAHRPQAATTTEGPSGPIISIADTSPPRERALSENGPPPTMEGLGAHLGDETAQTPSLATFAFPPLVPEAHQRSPSPSESLTIPGIAPQPSARQDSTGSGPGRGHRSPSPGSLRLHIPSRRSSASGRSETLSPFPGYTDSPLPMTPTSEIGMPHLELPVPAQIPSQLQLPGLQEAPEPAEGRWAWWPYSVLPPPEDVLGTLFPTLRGWSDKGAGDMFVSVISVPSVFLLSITLPVVDPRSDDGESTVTSEQATPTLRVETEWDRFRRRTRSMTHRSSVHGSPGMIALENTPDVRPIVQGIVPKIVRRPSEAVASVDEDPQRSGDPGSWNRWQVLLQIILGPPFAVFIIAWVLLEEPLAAVWKCLLWTSVACLLVFAFLMVGTSSGQRPKYHNLLCFPGFLVSVAWIVAIAGEVVGVLKAIGVILGISEAILGLTIFAAGNSLGDWVSNYTIARLGSPVMAFSGCIGGPMLNILLGIGIGGLLTMTSRANHKHDKHPDRPYKYQPYNIEISATLLVSAVTLLLTLIAHLVFVIRNKWVFSRQLGIGLIILWCTSTVVNIMIEGTGVWSDVSQVFGGKRG